MNSLVLKQILDNHKSSLEICKILVKDKRLVTANKILLLLSVNLDNLELHISKSVDQE